MGLQLSGMIVDSAVYRDGVRVGPELGHLAQVLDDVVAEVRVSGLGAGAALVLAHLEHALDRLRLGLVRRLGGHHAELLHAGDDDVAAFVQAREREEIVADPEVIAARLAARGRETAEQIAGRLRRSVPAYRGADTAVTIDNSGPLAIAGDALAHLVRARLSGAVARLRPVLTNPG